MKKVFISTIFIGAFLSYVAYDHVSSANSTFASGTAQDTSAIAGSNSTVQIVNSNTRTADVVAGSAPPVKDSSQSTTKATTKPASRKTSSGQYSDGTYTGAAADAYYGNIQVKVTISSGKITDVAFLQYPNDRSTSRYINQQAMPQLRAEAIQAQSSNVSGVSGASDSSAAFVTSLHSALSQAAA
jgi:uncharacterized protein with FMN-binding domain